jgi:predicted esterase
MAIHTQVYPEPYIILPSPPHLHVNTLILLHGTSTSGPEFAAPLLSTNFTCTTTQDPTTLPLFFPTCKLIFPTGAPNPTTVFDGRETNAWFNIHSFADRTIGEHTLVFRRGLGASVRYLAALVKAEVDILESRNDESGVRGKVVLGGFSQGAAMAIVLLLSGELEQVGVGAGFGGVVGLSGWLPLRSQIDQAIKDESHVYDTAIEVWGDKREKVRGFLRSYLELDDYGEGDNEVGSRKEGKGWLDIPVFLGHGQVDEKVRCDWGLQMADVLVGLGLNVQRKVYDGVAHWWNEEGIADMAGFLGKVWRGDLGGMVGEALAPDL